MKSLILVLSCIASTACGQVRRHAETGTFWKWAPSQTYHDAAVKIRTQIGAGSGIVILTDKGATHCLTNFHVIEGGAQGFQSRVTVEWQDGRKCIGRVVEFSRAENYDVAMIELPAVVPVGVPLCAVDPPIGSELEMVGFGGPQYGTARPFLASRIQSPHSDPLAIDAPTISGDSGSGILYGGCCVGVNFGGPTGNNRALSESEGPIGLVYPATSHVSPPILTRLVSQWLSQYGCQPRISNPGQYGPGVPSDGQFYPPAQPSIPQPGQPVPIPQQPTQPRTECIPITFEYSKVAEALEKRPDFVALIAAELSKNDSLRGPAGKDGAPGRDGQPGPAGAAGPPGVVDVEAVATAVASRIKFPSADFTKPNIDEIASAVIAKLPPIQVETYDRDGKKLDAEAYPYPGPIKLRYGVVK